jgi:hypothetical protein
MCPTFSDSNFVGHQPTPSAERLSAGHDFGKTSNRGPKRLKVESLFIMN